jgi:hypothetical protein
MTRAIVGEGNKKFAITLKSNHPYITLVSCDNIQPEGNNPSGVDNFGYSPIQRALTGL